MENIQKQLNMEIRIINRSDFPLPKYETIFSAGVDLRANNEEEIVLQPLGRALIPTGLFIELPVGFEAQIRPRSGMAIKHGITVLNSPGTIDSDYRGEIGVILVNLSDSPYQIGKGERICQMVISKVEQVAFIEADALEGTERGSGGFGHTGKK